MSEVSMRNTFKEKIEAHYGRHLKYQRIEDKFASSVPDAIFTLRDDATEQRLTAAIEFKFLPKLPTRAATMIRLDFRPGQTTWLKRWDECGGTSLVCVRIQLADMWLMFNDHFKELELGMTLPTFLSTCTWRAKTLEFPTCLQML